MKARLAPFLVLLEARYAPLLCAVAPQAYAVYLWLFPAPYDLWGEIFAVAGAVGYEFVYVGAIAWAEEGRSSVWTWATATVALLFSVVVAYYVYRAQGAWAWLHAGFPLVAFTYTLNMYSKRPASRSADSARAALEALSERSRSTEAASAGTDTGDATGAWGQAPVTSLTGQSLENERVLEIPVFERLEDFKDDLLRRLAEVHYPGVPLDQIKVVERPAKSNGVGAYECPHCRAPLRSKQARGAAVANGFCPACKSERLSAQRN